MAGPRAPADKSGEPAAPAGKTAGPGPGVRAAKDVDKAFAPGAPGAAGGAGATPARRGPSGGGGAVADGRLSRWKAGVSRATGAIPKADLSPVSESPGKLEADGRKLNDARRKARPDHLAAARAKIKPEPKPENAPPTPVRDPVPEATTVVRKAANRRLPDESLPPVTRSPGHPRLGDGRGQLPSLRPVIPPDNTARPDVATPGKGEKPVPNPNAEKVKKKLASAKARKGTGASAGPVALKDPGRAPDSKPSGELVEKIEDALAHLLASKDELAKNFVDGAADTVYPHKALRSVAPEIPKAMLDPEKQEITALLERVAEASGIAKDSLREKAAKLRKEIEKTGKTTADGLTASGKKTHAETKKRGTEDRKAIASAAETVESEIAAKSEAASGSVDPKIIEAKKERLLQKSREDVAAGKAAYARAGETRKREADAAGNKQITAYRVTAAAEAKAIRALYEDDTEGRLQAKPSLDWGFKGGKETSDRVGLIKLHANREVERLQKALDTAGDTAREKIRDWAAHKLGEERSWWDRLIDAIRDWFSQAIEDKKAWEKAEARLARDDMVADFAKLEEVRAALASGNKEKLDAAMAGLTADQKAVVAAFFGSGGNAVKAVATGMLLRLQRQRTAKLIEEARDRSLKLTKWEKLDALGKSQNPGFDADTVARAVFDAVEGIGTNEAKIYSSLAGRTPVQVAAIRLRYSVKYPGRDIEDDLKGDLSGEEERRALAQLKGDHIGADVAALREAIEGWGTDEATIMKVLRNKTPAEREEILRRYKEQYNVDLKADLKDDLSGKELKRADLLLDGEVAKADAVAIEYALNEDGWFGPDRDAAEAVYRDIRTDVETEAAARGMTTAEINAELRRRNKEVAAAFDASRGRKGALTAAYNAEFTGPELDLMKGLHDVDPIAIDAARLRIEVRSFWTDDDKVNETLKAQYERAKKATYRDIDVRLNERARAEKWPPGKIAAERKRLRKAALKDIERMGKENMRKMESTYDAKYSTFGAGRLRLDLAKTTGGYEKDMAFELLAQGGKLSKAQEVHYAVAGVGTHTDALKAVFRDDDGKPLKKEEIRKIKAEYRKKYGRDMADDIYGDVSGRDEKDMEWALRGAPENPADMMKLLEERRKWELEHGSGWFKPDPESKALETSFKETKEAYDEYAKAKALYGDKDPRTRKAKARFDRFGGYVEGDIEQFRKGVDRVADYAATAAELTVVAAGVILGAIFTGGTASAATLAAYAAITAGASATAGIATRAAIKGGAYGWEDLATDAAIGGIDAAAAALTFGASKALLQTTKLARLAKGGLGARLIAHFLAEGAEGALGALPPALAGTLLSDATWEGGNPFEAILLGTAMGTGMAFGMGGGLGAFGGIRAPDVKTPSARADLDASVSARADADTSAAIAHDVPGTRFEGPPPKPDADFEVPGLRETPAPTPMRPDADIAAPKRLDADEVAGAKALPEADPELAAALPRDLRGKVPVHVDADLPGNTVRVHYEVDANGLIKNVHMRIGRGARPVDIQLHGRTARLLRRYGGISGRVLQLIERLNVFIAKYGDPPVGSRAWEARFELEKLPRIMRERAKRLARGGLGADEELDLRIELMDLEAQLLRHRATLDAMDLEPGEGFVAAARDEEIKTHAPDLLSRSDLPGQLGEKYRSWDAFFEDYYFAKHGDNYRIVGRREGLPGLRLDHPDDLSTARIIQTPELDRSYAAVKARAAAAHAEPLKDFPEFETALEKRLLPPDGSAGWTPEDAGQVRKWAGIIKVLHDEMAARGSVPGDFFDRLFDGIDPRLGLGPDFGEAAYRRFRSRVREQIADFIADIDDGVKRRELLNRFLHDLQPDIKSKGEQLSAYRRSRMRSASGGRFEPIEDVPLTIHEPVGDAKIADGAITVSADGPPGAPPPGRYLVEDKAGAAAFKPSQADGYSARLENGAGSIETSRGTPPNMKKETFDGVVYIFDDAKSTDQALAKIGDLDQPNALHEKIYIGYYDESGTLQWLPRGVAPTTE
jgi:hypothetical protein